jgi:IS30 family transposase
LGVVGNIGAMALTEGSRWAVNKLMQKSNSGTAPAPKLNEKSKQIIEELKRGNGIKRFKYSKWK